MSTQSKPSTATAVPTKILGVRPKSAFVPAKDFKGLSPERNLVQSDKGRPKAGAPMRRENTPQARNEANLQSVSELAYVKKQVTTLKTQLDELGFKNLELAEALKTKDSKITEMEAQVEKLKNQ